MFNVNEYWHEIAMADPRRSRPSAVIRTYRESTGIADHGPAWKPATGHQSEQSGEEAFSSVEPGGSRGEGIARRRDGVRLRDGVVGGGRGVHEGDGGDDVQRGDGLRVDGRP